jgi:hypothetical protein
LETLKDLDFEPGEFLRQIRADRTRRMIAGSRRMSLVFPLVRFENQRALRGIPGSGQTSHAPNADPEL